MAKIKARKAAAGKPLPVPVHFAVGWAAGALVLAAMLLLSAWLVSAMGLPLGALEILMLLSAAIGSLAAGWVTARRYGQKGLLCGAAAGGLLFIAQLLAAMALGSRLPGLSDCMKAAVFLTAAMIGGILGVQKADRKGR